MRRFDEYIIKEHGSYSNERKHYNLVGLIKAGGECYLYNWLFE